jgi:transcriptional regulator with XRE-family HTH domain
MDSSSFFELCKVFMISELLRKIMQECGLKQKDLADVLGVPLQRVKHLCAGNVHKFAADETRRLVQTLNLNAHWLATGTGAMFNPLGGEQLGSVLTHLKLSSTRVVELGLEGDDAQAARDIATGVAAGNLAMVKSALEVLRHKPSSQEQLLLDAYHRCTPQARTNLIQTATLLSVGLASATAAGNTKRSAKDALASSNKQVINAPVGGHVAGGNVTISKTNKNKK